MVAIVTRAGKGSQLTTAEVDANFDNLNNGKAELSGAAFTGDVGVPSINGGPLAGLRNKLIGGHFDSNPWQRGTSFTVTSTATYVADRWRLDFDGSANLSVAKVALPAAQVINGVFCRYGMKITVNSKSGGTYMRLSQRIEGADMLTTLAATLQTATLGSAAFSVPAQLRQSFGTGGSPSADVVTPFAASLALTASMQLLHTGLTVPDMSSKTLGSGANDFLGVEYDLTNVPVGGYILMALAGFEYGNNATVWEERRRLEPGLCQRYLWPVLGSFLGYANGSTVADCAVSFPPMRATPTIFQGASAVASVVTGAGNTSVQSSVGITFPGVGVQTPQGASLRFNNFTGLTSGSVANVYTNAITPAGFLTAEL